MSDDDDDLGPLPPPPGTPQARPQVSSWFTEEEAELEGRSFLGLFDDREHYNSSLATGSMAKPRSLKDRARLQADPMRMAREKLRRAVEQARRNLKRTEDNLAKARKELATPFMLFPWKTQPEIAQLTQQLEQRKAALANAEVTLELFDIQPRENTP